jgi:hypothetical protein
VHHPHQAHLADFTRRGFNFYIIPHLDAQVRKLIAVNDDFFILWRPGTLFQLDQVYFLFLEFVYCRNVN